MTVTRLLRTLWPWAEIARLCRDCGEAYQIVGSMTYSGHEAEKLFSFNHPDVTRVLDNLSAAASGCDRPHDDLLPWPKTAGDLTIASGKCREAKGFISRDRDHWLDPSRERILRAALLEAVKHANNKEIPPAEIVKVWELIIEDTRGSEQTKQCQCRQCLRDRNEHVMGLPVETTRMILCAKCGNKRCPHAADHRHECTDSNEPGQPGSAYA